MKQKNDLSILARAAETLTNAGRAAVLLLAVMLLTMTAQTAWAAPGDILVVDCNGGGQYTSISEAVAAADGGETIFIKNGEYTETSKINIGTKQLTFTGESQDGVIIKSGDNDLFYTTGSEGASLVISGLTFKDISMTGARVPIFIGGNDNVEITDCTFDNCASRYGAMRIYTSGTVTVDNCNFLGTKSSTGSYSSAIDFGGSGTADYTLKNSIIDGSAIADGGASYIFGAIYNEKNTGLVTLDNVTISNCNLVASGIISTKGNMKIKNSRIVNNYVYRDNLTAGLFFVNGAKDLTIETTVIADNSEPNYILSANSPSATYNLNYNNIQNNSFVYAFVNPDYATYTLEANYWGSNTLPEGITANTWVVNNNGNYELNDGSPLDKEIPRLANVVTQRNFSNFFDQDGNLLDAVTVDELIFQGEFSIDELIDQGKLSNWASYITIGRALTVTSDNAVLNKLALRITDDDVTVTGLTLNEDGADFTDNDGAAIYVNGSGVTLDGVSVTYNAPDEVEAKAIFANGADNFKLINSEIIFTGANPGSEHYRGLEVRDCDAAKIDKNTISAVLPAVDVDYNKGLGTIDPDLVLAVGIQGGDDVEFTNNIVNVNTSGGIGDFPTIDAVMVYDANDIVITGNKITLMDNTPEESPRYYYSLDIYSTTGTVEANDITVNTTTATNDVERAGTAYPIQLSEPYEVTVKDNNITAVSKGTVVGINSTNWYGAGDLTAENNIIDVTGYVTTVNYTLVAGIEAEAAVFKASNNTITVANGADYDDANKVIGVGIGYPYNSGVTSVDITDNIMTVDGKYAVYYAEAENANVTGNALCAHELTGDDAVYIGDGNNNTVANNQLGYVIPKTGKSTYDIPANVPSFKVYDDGGTSRKYSPDCNGILTLTAPEGCMLQLSGTIKTEKGVDYLTVYDGSSNQAATLINKVSSTDDGTETAIETVTSTGQSLTLYFQSDNKDSDDSEFDGLDLTVKIYKTVGTCGADLTWTLTDENSDDVFETLTISGTGDMADYDDADDQPWKDYRDDITTVIIGDGVTSIGDCAFDGCTALESVAIGSGVTSIGTETFLDCTDLTSITIPTSVTSIGADAFKGCTGVTDVYCYADPTSLTWNEDDCDDFNYDDSNPYTKTKCHVFDASTWTTKFSSTVNVDFVGDLGTSTCPVELTEGDGVDLLTSLAAQISDPSNPRTDVPTTLNVTFSRTFDTSTNGTGKASTVCLPYAVAKPDATTVGTFYTFGGVTEDQGVYTVTMNEMTADATTAGTPYLFKPAVSSGSSTVPFNGNIPIEASYTAGNKPDTDGWEFRGTYEKLTWPSGQTRLYGFAAADFEKSDGTLLNDVGAFRRFDWGYCDAFRCYLWAPDPNAGARGATKSGSALPQSMRVILVAADGTTTGIGTLDTKTGDVTFDGEAWYSLDGSRLSGKPTKNGMYIHNGKAVVIKN